MFKFFIIKNLNIDKNIKIVEINENNENLILYALIIINTCIYLYDVAYTTS